MKKTMQNLLIIFFVFCFFTPKHVFAQGANEAVEKIKSEIDLSFETLDKLLEKSGESFKEVNLLLDEIEDVTPKYDEMEDTIPSIQQSNQSLKMAKDNLDLFSLYLGDDIFSLDGEKFNSCVSREVYAGSIKLADETMGNVIAEISKFDKKIDLEYKKFEKQGNRANDAVETLEGLESTGALTEEQSDEIAGVLSEIELIYNEVYESLDDANDIVEMQKTPFEERQQLAKMKYAEFQSNPNKCYHAMAGKWIDNDFISGRFKSTICLAQDKYSISGTQTMIRIVGGSRRVVDYGGSSTEGNTLSLKGAAGTVKAWEIENGSTSTARICTDIRGNRECHVWSGNC